MVIACSVAQSPCPCSSFCACRGPWCCLVGPLTGSSRGFACPRGCGCCAVDRDSCCVLVSRPNGSCRGFSRGSRTCPCLCGLCWIWQGPSLLGCHDAARACCLRRPSLE